LTDRQTNEMKNPIPGEHKSASQDRVRMILKAIILIVILIGSILAAKHFNLQHVFRNVLELIEKSGYVGLLVFFGLYIASTVLMLPGTILTLGAGAMFGVVKGSVLVSLSSTAGAAAAFVAGRYFARGIVTRRIAGNPTFQAMDEAVANEGWKIVGLTRLSPIFPFNLLNYVFGLTRISLRDYALASWIGMIPGTIMYVYIGSLAGSLAELGTKQDGRIRSPAEWSLYVIGLVATVAITVVITRIARRALNRRMQSVTDQKGN